MYCGSDLGHLCEEGSVANMNSLLSFHSSGGVIGTRSCAFQGAGIQSKGKLCGGGVF